MNLKQIKEKAVKEFDVKFVKKLADIEHKRWSHWQRYLHSKCFTSEDGELIIPKESVEHWKKQINTEYKDLTEKEKDSDRNEVLKYSDKFKKFLLSNLGLQFGV